jgi:hypothetical protein
MYLSFDVTCSLGRHGMHSSSRRMNSTSRIRSVHEQYGRQKC